MNEKSEDRVFTREEKIAQAQDLFGLGYRNYALKCYSDAADDLSQACKLYEEIYGEFADELGEPYLLYAKSLIAIGQEINKVIDLPDVEEDEEDENDDDNGDGDGEDAKEDQTDTMAKKPEENIVPEINEAESTNGEQKYFNGDAECTNDDAEPSTSNGNGLTEEKDNEVETDEVDENLQVAWETLELAAKIFERQGETALENLAEVYENLASISFENSHFIDTISDYGKALKIHLNLPGYNKRVIAEIYYKIGLAYLMQNSFDKCTENLKYACNYINDEIESQKKKSLTDEIKKLVEDLEEMKKDIEEKITEVAETKHQSYEDVKRELSKFIGTNVGATDGSGPSSSSKSSLTENPVSVTSSTEAKDISHLIKRKRPSSPSGEASPAKRTTPS